MTLTSDLLFECRLRPATDIIAAVGYRFEHSDGSITVAEFARLEGPDNDEHTYVYNNASAHLDRLFSLRESLLGRLAIVGERVEDTVLEPSEESNTVDIKPQSGA